jgi:hypothetical protein
VSELLPYAFPDFSSDKQSYRYFVRDILSFLLSSVLAITPEKPVKYSTARSVHILLLRSSLRGLSRTIAEPRGSSHERRLAS